MKGNTHVAKPKGYRGIRGQRKQRRERKGRRLSVERVAGWIREKRATGIAVGEY